LYLQGILNKKSAATPRTPAKPRRTTSRRAVMVDLQSLDAQLEDNLTLKFYDGDEFLRERTFSFRGSSNKSVQKLFMAAQGAGLLANADATQAGSILSLSVSGLARPCNIVYDKDDGQHVQDFDDFVEKLKKAPCWRMSADGKEIECVVEVRELKLLL
jgi:hypothetical protein